MFGLHFHLLFFSFAALYLVIRIQYAKEKNKFISKYGTLDNKKS